MALIRKNKKKTEKRVTMKMLLCILYLIVITVLFVCAYSVFKDKEKTIPWDKVTTADQYAYIDISQMSEKFAYFSDSKKQIHFVIEKEDTGLWHTYLIAINEEDYNQYKDIIDYTYQRTDKVPEKKRVYGYPVIINSDLKRLAINNITNFIPAENEVVITNENFNEYLTNSYLDVTNDKKDSFNFILMIILLMIFIVIVLFIIAWAIAKSSKKDVKLEFNKLVEYLGGMDNIVETEVEMSRFKVTLKDVSKANKEGIIKLGAKGVVEIDDQLKIIFGSGAKQLKKYIDQLK